MLLAPILALTEETNWRAHGFAAAEMEKAQQAIVPNVRATHASWLVRRDKNGSVARPMRRNDPRPCGSGKKYKQCCLH